MTANRMRGMPLLEVGTCYSRVTRWYKSLYREEKINRAIFNQPVRVVELFLVQKVEVPGTISIFEADLVV